MSLASLKNPNDLQSIVLINKLCNVVSVVSLKNVDKLSVALILILVAFCREGNKLIGL